MSQYATTYGLIARELKTDAVVSVSRGELVAADMLIGMDIISLGDMLVTNKPTTEFTFRIPSEGREPFDASNSTP